MELVSGITIIPYLHGKIFFARQIRNLCLEHKYDCIAVDVPSVFQDYLSDAVDKLPIINAIIARENEELAYYVPIDPCDAAIEAIRQGSQNRIPSICIGSPVLMPPNPLPALPDEYAGTQLKFDIFSALNLYATGNFPDNSDEDLEGQFIAHRIHELRAAHKNILVLVHFRNYVRTVHHFNQEKTCNLKFDYRNNYTMISRIINPEHLYFALGELPFITGKYEKERYDLFADPFDTIESIKDLFRETRDNYYNDKEDVVTLSPVRIQAALTFLRNLTVMSGHLIPSLFDIIEAAKGVGGNAYAVRILKSARYYPYIPFEKKSEMVATGIDRISVSDWGTIDAINLFRDFSLQWRTVSIKPDPSLERKKKYRYTWNPFGMCSHVPEDRRIELFNLSVRQKALKVLVEDLVRTEKFSSSVKDGIDIRETMRNWHTGNIYVKETPPSRGKIDTVVIIFDESNDALYPHCATWYAEHVKESTLSFYASDPMKNMIGPGIAQCTYGGLALIFPPRHTPDLFTLSQDLELPNLAARLTYGSLLFSHERVVAYIAQKKPGAYLRKLAASLKKHLLWIPIQTFSNETLRRLQKFHILNGKDVRSWAARFIGD